MLFENATYYTTKGLAKGNLTVKDGRVYLSGEYSSSDGPKTDAKELLIVPGFVDVHVHLREPGFFIRRALPPARNAVPAAGTRTCAPCPI